MADREDILHADVIFRGHGGADAWSLSDNSPEGWKSARASQSLLRSLVALLGESGVHLTIRSAFHGEAVGTVAAIEACFGVELTQVETSDEAPGGWRVQGTELAHYAPSSKSPTAAGVARVILVLADQDVRFRFAPPRASSPAEEVDA